MIEGRPENDKAVNDLILKVLFSPDAGELAYHQALRRARAIAEGRSWDRAALFPLGVAQFRNGDYSGSVATLEQYARLNGIASPWTNLFLAMAYNQLKHYLEARQHLQAGRLQMDSVNGSEDVRTQLRGILHEAETQIGPSPAK
jgi:hypothetical protein